MPQPFLKGFADWLWYFFCGLCMGAADIIPGVSGGTMAFILGFYESLISNVKNINFKVLGLVATLKFSKLSKYIAWQFLLILVLGILVAIASMSQVITRLLNHEVSRVYLYSGFLGLILASVIFCIRKVEKWTLRSVLSLVVGGIAAFMLTNFTVVRSSQKNITTYNVAISENFSESKNVSNYDPDSHLLLGVSLSTMSAMLAKGYITKESPIINTSTGEKAKVGDVVASSKYPIILPWIVFCGAVGISAMLLPGISGSYLLTILGTYPLVISALADLVSGLKNLQVDHDAAILIANLLVGILIGAALFSRVISWLFAHYHNATIALLVGFMIGALKSVWPFWIVEYQLIPIKLPKGPQLVGIQPTLPELGTPLFWTSLFIIVASFILVFCLEIIAARKGKI